MKIIKDDKDGARILASIDDVVKKGRIDQFVSGFKGLAETAANDLNAEVASEDDEYFDHKNLLKSQKWSKSTAAKILAQYKKDVLRKKADPISSIFQGILD